MVSVTKENLKNLVQVVGKNEPRKEMNYLYVDENNIVSTNARAMVIVEHQYDVETPFLVSGAAVALALKVNARSYKLLKDRVECYDKEENMIVAVSSADPGEFKYPKYKRIIPTGCKKVVKFAQRTAIDGIFAVNCVDIDGKFIPNIGSGEVHLETNVRQVMIKSRDGITTAIILPIIGFFEEKEFTA